MEAEQVQWASQLRKIPIRFHQALRSEDDRAIRHCPAMQGWIHRHQVRTRRSLRLSGHWRHVVLQ